MEKLGFANGYEPDEELEDDKLAAINPDYTPDYNSIKSLLDQVKQVNQAPGYKPPKTDYTPMLASALSNMSAAAGTLGGKTADTSYLSDFSSKIMDQDRKLQEQTAKEIENQRTNKLRDLNSKLELTKMLRSDDIAQKRYALDQQKASDLSKYREGLLAKREPSASTKRESSASTTGTGSERMGPTKTISTIDEEGFPVTALIDPQGNIVKSFRKDKTASSNEIASLGFGMRLESAIAALDRLEERGYDRTSYKQGIASGLPDWSKNQNLRLQEQAERNFVNAVLRDESGAVIGTSEFESAEKQYFPRAGDGPEVLANKRQNRKQKLQEFAMGAGPYWNQRSNFEVIKDKPRRRQSPNSGEAFAATPDDDMFSIGDVRQVNGKDWVYQGNDKWVDATQTLPNPIPQKDAFVPKKVDSTPIPPKKEYKVGDIQEANGKTWKYTGNNIWTEV